MNIRMRWKSLFRLFPIVHAYITKSLYRKMLFAFFMTITITVTTLGLYYYVQTSSEIKLREIDNMEKLSEQSAAKLETQMANIKSVAWDYFADSRFQQFVMNMGSDPDAYSDYSGKFSQFVTDNPAVEFIMAGRLDDYRLIKGNIDITDVVDFDDIQAAAIANDGKGAWVQSITFDRQTGQKVSTLTFVQAIKKVNIISDSPIVGVLMIQLSYEYFSEWLKGIGAREQAQYMLVDSVSGTVEIAADPALVGTKLSDLGDLMSLSRSHPSRHRFGMEHGKATLFVSHRLENTSWVLIGKIPLRVLLAQVNAIARDTIMIGIICLLGAMVIAGVLSSRITVPLKELKKGIRSIEKGDYDIALQARSKDETGYIVHRFNQMAAEIKALIVRVYEADLVKKDAEIRSLQSQINPHFLYNTLGIIDSLATLQEDERISLISRSLAKMFRYSISAGRLFTLQAEMRQIELYLYIQQQRFSDRLHYSIEIDDDIYDIRVPKLLFQPIVENIFIHAFDGMTTQGEIRIRAWRVSDADIRISVWNNGPNIDPAKLEELRAMLEHNDVPGGADKSSSSIGLINVQRRIRLVYGSEYGLTIQSEPDRGTEVLVRIRKLGEEEHRNEAHDH